MENTTFALCPDAATNLLKQWPNYAPTPIRRVANSMGNTKLLIKDETNRMRQGSFKAVGGGYAVARLVMGRASKSKVMLSDLRENACDKTFICASAGNHGVSVAAGAQYLGASSRIHLSKRVPSEFITRLTRLGAKVIRSGETYEDSVSCAIEDAAQGNGIHLADGSWPGYTEPPRLVMEGYTIIAEEMRLDFEQCGDWPSHVFLQAGVGGLAGAITYMIRKNWAVQPHICVVEPDFAPCLHDSMKAGYLIDVQGPASNMGRLDCKTASLLAFEILSQKADAFVTVSDQQAQLAAKALAAQSVATTPSGAAGYAAFLQAKLDENSNALIIVTEGAIT
ncbi:pyridoxal-phosphate dependent enzyme [Pacificibacter marinus]|uniref:pyridoxal-phosphate dependent enzyme n=1 Tax=Pacificibacter marinus TaxID=658057 RepID=UPI001C06A2BE|nr:pyridoxal-phosphate dependent enzyme [Pacificibacter marinus]MBU2867570.1 pyridoxal-phosphate dependent enzyme [Pacificibacter marinus]